MNGQVFLPSRHFTVPGNGGSINFGCYLAYPINWETVAAIGHTHPLYKDPLVNSVNKYFSAGDPLILFTKNIPIYLRTPKGKEIKVLEIRDNWVTTRKISLTKTHKLSIGGQEDE